jgi:hypothetical protein
MPSLPRGHGALYRLIRSHAWLCARLTAVQGGIPAQRSHSAPRLRTARYTRRWHICIGECTRAAKRLALLHAILRMRSRTASARETAHVPCGRVPAAARAHMRNDIPTCCIVMPVNMHGTSFARRAPRCMSALPLTAACRARAYLMPAIAIRHAIRRPQAIRQISSFALSAPVCRALIPCLPLQYVSRCRRPQAAHSVWRTARSRFRFYLMCLCRAGAPASSAARPDLPRAKLSPAAACSRSCSGARALPPPERAPAAHRPCAPRSSRSPQSLCQLSVKSGK